MGQKVNPIGLRLGINRTWDSRWYAEGGEYSTMLHEDIHIRKVLRERLAQAGIAKIVIERTLKLITVTVHTARPGIVIGRRGAEADRLKKQIEKIAAELYRALRLIFVVATDRSGHIEWRSGLIHFDRLDEASTVPAPSMPTIIGKRRTTGDLPVMARPSL